jgi:hypothetical protein
MNTANLQLEGLYLSIAALTNLLVSKGVVSREDVAGALKSAEQTALTDYRAGELRPANRDAVAFASRFLQLANNSAGDGATPGFGELARLVGQLKDEPALPQRAVGDEDPDYSPMDGFRGDRHDAGAAGRRPDMPGAESIASARADEDTYD